MSNLSELLGSYVAVGLFACFVVVVLVILFTWPEMFGWTQCRVYLISFGAQQGYHPFSYMLLFFIDAENLTTILRAYVGAYTISLCRVVYLEE